MSHKQNRTTAVHALRLGACAGLALSLLLVTGCGAGPRPAPAPPCDQACQDGVALLGLRTAMKVAYNFTVSAHPVGAQDAMVPCISFDGKVGGSVHIFGDDVEVDAKQGASIIPILHPLSYDFKNCLYSAPPDPTADQNYSLTLDGLVTETGTLSAQPTSTTSLIIQTALDPTTMQPTDTLSISGTVYDPPVDYAVSNCALSVIQNGNAVSGALCGRNAGFMF
ncbi:MAG TPA: hypothetical protein VNW92_00815 [Polyangiaceae bacterium]|jgi:hypothetical protein|nr:hypothetical protein [Polyangiaceae bacterium]